MVLRDKTAAISTEHDNPSFMSAVQGLEGMTTEHHSSEPVSALFPEQGGLSKVRGVYSEMCSGPRRVAKQGEQEKM